MLDLHVIRSVLTTHDEKQISELLKDSNIELLVFVLEKSSNTNSAKPDEDSGIIKQLQSLQWQPAVFDKSGKIMSVAPDKLASEIRAFFQAHNNKFEDDSYIYTFSAGKGWLNKKPKENEKK
jgi:hypothetical protein